ncbi:MAG: hypothetical protein KGJ37_07710, partial [Verrucomicrobiota bacterium]|nr:hypothetical protein [Verrucomicrobiota bacterium]
CKLADWRGRLWGCFLGDQGIFVRSSVFRSLGGFRLLDKCEDLDFSLRLAKAGRTCALRTPVITSARRFEKRGAVRQTFIDLITAYRFIRSRRPESGPPNINPTTPPTGAISSLPSLSRVSADARDCT